MMKTICLAAVRSLLLALALLSTHASVRGETGFHCGHAAVLAAADAPGPRQYVPSREIDILHLALDITPDFRQRTIQGQATLRFKPIAKPFPELRLDAVDLTITNVSSTEKIAGWHLTSDKVIVTFAEPIPPDREASVTLRYRAQPSEGLYFRTRELGYKPEDEHLWTQGEAIRSRHWFPCFDAPNEKFTSEITCRVPEGMTVLSNGRKVSEETDGGWTTVRWLQDKPHVAYLISLVAGRYQKIEDRHRDIPLAFWALPSDFPEAANSFEGTKDMMAFFEQEIGVPYPWAKYDQVCVQDFVVSGMENTSITTLKSETLFRKETENLRNSQGLVAHELAHQWFGDLVTCKEWSEIWMNEGFATYYEHLYDGHKHGRDQLLYRLWSGARSLAAKTNDLRPIVNRVFHQPGEQFSHLTYGKGAWILHMLRSELGPELFRRCIRTFLERHAYGSVDTEDLNEVVEELSGRSFDRFFDQWVYHGGAPLLEVDYSWDERSRLARLTVRQIQVSNDKVLPFEFPLAVRFQSKSGAVNRSIFIKARNEDFYFALPEKPDIVRIDPELALLARINCKLPVAMTFAQLGDPADVVGRLEAAAQLRFRKDHESVARLKETLNRDAFYGVRMEASKALRAIHTEEALEALLASTEQEDARVRRQVLSDIGGFYHERAYGALRSTLSSEQNPDIIAEVITALGAYAKPEIQEILRKHLRSESYRDHLAAAAIRGLRAQDDPKSIEPLLEVLKRRETELPSRTFGAGLEALAWLAREQSEKDAVRGFLLRQTRHPKRSVQLAAIGALGTLNDPRTLPALETFAAALDDSPERKAAEKSLGLIRDGRTASAEVRELRKEVLALQKDGAELKKELEILKKKLDATASEKDAPAGADS